MARGAYIAKKYDKKGWFAKLYAKFRFRIFLIAAPGVLFAGLSKGGFGSGVAFVSAVILALIIEPFEALAIILPLLMLIDLVTLRPYWGVWNFADAKVLILGGIPGIALGALLFQVVDADIFRLLIGAVSLGFVLWSVLQVRSSVHDHRRPWPDWIGVLLGSVTGFTSFVAHAGGPPAAIFLLSRQRRKTEYQATTVLVFWVLNIVKFCCYFWLGMMSLQSGLVGILLAPFALAGAYLGVYAHGIIPERLFFKLAFFCCAASTLQCNFTHGMMR